MSRDWEEQFRKWAKPPGKTEEERCKNSVSAIKNAMAASDDLDGRDISVFIQGSYRNNTNVSQDSDVDIGIVCNDVFFYADLPGGLTKESLGFESTDYTYRQFKNEVGAALSSYFGDMAVQRGNKAFDVHETSYHVDADVASFLEHRRYKPDRSKLIGVELESDSGKRIVNWPEKHYENGVEKNKVTGTYNVSETIEQIAEKKVWSFRVIRDNLANKF